MAAWRCGVSKVKRENDNPRRVFDGLAYFNKNIARLGLRFGMVAIVALTLISCTGPCRNDKNQIFRDGLPGVNFGNELSIGVTGRAEDEVELLVRNETADYILFDSEDLGIRAFVFDEGTCSWREIENSIVFHPNEEFVLGPVEDEIVNSYPTYFKPENPEEIPNLEYRIIVSGRKLEDGVVLDDIVAAFIDVKE